ncbi:hypothetical protein LZC95_27105 [Pendulispora brunnea]|uniref:Uncharacterized protein n=1 Tax=Pendulispora brunnea TaxID=2905690 RepID=A0ABZ2JUR1_9BACT
MIVSITHDRIDRVRRFTPRQVVREIWSMGVRVAHGQCAPAIRSATSAPKPEGMAAIERLLQRLLFHDVSLKVNQ